MASFLPLQLPNTLRNPRLVSASISSNGSVPSSSNQSSPSGKGGPVIIELPLNQIRRPLMRTRSNDPHKVQELMDSIAQIGLQVPIRVWNYGLTYGLKGDERRHYSCHPSSLLSTGNNKHKSSWFSCKP
ncbi:hypothetical protein QVD17_05191 [Tagetes erecta]|uniref:Sulfiredoxin n=1 Tax=Tagetes erecta TaxID=13708 RepID=A0AAD8LEK1_TARER|nr:hypothetical protein QVD17_05191 [Tagetes erecta]